MAKPNANVPFKAAVVGGTGYGGAELIRSLLGHPSIALTRVSSIDSVDEPLEAVHLNLSNTGLTFEKIPLAEAAEGVDVMILGLPHKLPCKMAPELEALSCKVVDMSGDFRLNDEAKYAEFYGMEHPHPEQLHGRWQFGLPELYREEIKKADRVASPGCFATTIMVGLLPLAKAGLLSGPVQTVAATGSSGSGAYASAGTHHPLRANNMKPYKVLAHQHVPEIEMALNDAIARGGNDTKFALHFVPVSAPLPRGILSTSFVRVPESFTKEDADKMFTDYFADSQFVRALGSGGRAAEVVAIKGSMWVDLSWKLSEPDGFGKQLAISTALDNLVKGGAGQALQSMNLMLGLPEGDGIDAPALWP
jgi:N-acetyl-gamma-glutamyl-phosphate reductase